MTKKLSATKQWMIDHPDDEPCPLPQRSPNAAAAWRRKRDLDGPDRAANPQWAKYQAAMAEKKREHPSG
jgi:hypothetical protein